MTPLTSVNANERSKWKSDIYIYVWCIYILCCVIYSSELILTTVFYADSLEVFCILKVHILKLSNFLLLLECRIKPVELQIIFSVKNYVKTNYVCDFSLLWVFPWMSINFNEYKLHHSPELENSERVYSERMYSERMRQ